MRTVKIMLMTIGILAVVGGVLAFKAMRQDICYYERIGSQGACTLKNQDMFSTGTTIATGNIFNTTLAKVAGVCPAQANCLRRHEIVKE